VTEEKRHVYLCVADQWRVIKAKQRHCTMQINTMQIERETEEERKNESTHVDSALINQKKISFE